MPTAYIVEDDEDIRDTVIYALNNAGFKTAGFESGEAFFQELKNNPGTPNIVLLDIMLPGEDGLAILKRLRGAPRTKDLPVIMLTAKGSELDKVKGLDLGADDYMVKPFGVMELISRINAVLKRSGTHSETCEKLEYENISIDNSRRAVFVDGQPVSLTYKEYELLSFLMQNSGFVLERDNIMKEVWGHGFVGESRTLDIHIQTLRKKLGTAGGHITTIRNVGYMLGNN